jgi:hypothetical protein
MSSTLASPLAKAFGVVIFTFFALTAATRAGEPIVTAAEANGTYRDIESKSEIKILALGHGKLKVQLALVYQRQFATTVNVGDALGEATIENNVAVFVPEAAGDCKITLTFLPNHELKVEQEGGECGFGHNVRADGIFRKVNKRKPKLEDM